MKKMFIGGQWVAAQDGRTLPVIDPADGQPFDEIPRGTAADVDRAVQAARAASGAWGNTPATDRGRILCKIAEAVLAHEDELARLEARDTGKPMTTARNDIKVFQGAARFVGPNELLVSGFNGDETLKAKRFLIAVGTRPADARGVTLDGEIAVTSDSLLNLKRLPRSVVVVGAGVIGIEYASMFAALGLKVTVVDKRPRPLEFLDHEIVDELIHQLRKVDVTFRCGDGLKSLEITEGDRKQALLELESGKYLIAEMVLISTGRVGCTEGLGLEVVGLSADERGRIKTDGHFQTAVPHIYAAGDVIGYPSLAATSSEQGRLAALHMFGEETAPLGDRFPIGIYSIPEISMMGETEEGLTAKKVPYETGIARYNETARGQILGDHSGMFKMIFHRDTEKLLGVHCIGSGATELVHIGQAVMLLGGGLDYFINSVFNYPTLAECYKIAALNAYNKIQLIRKVQKLRHSQRLG
jgi:NAD(P) transhydrogenase